MLSMRNDDDNDDDEPFLLIQYRIDFFSKPVFSLASMRMELSQERVPL